MQRPDWPRPTLLLRHLAAVIVVLCLATPALRAEGDYRKSFRSGIGALDRRRFAEAAAAFREALRASGSESGERILIYGTLYVPYLPHLYLAVALKGQNDCAGALEEIEASEGQRAVQRFAEYGELKKIRTNCGSRPTVVTASSSPTPRTEVPPMAGSPLLTEPKPAPQTATVALVPEPKRELAPTTVPRQQPASIPAVSDTVAVARAAALTSNARDELQRALAEANGLLHAEITPGAQDAHRKLTEAVRKAMQASTSNVPGTLTGASAQLGASMAELKKVMAPGAIRLDGRVVEAIRAYVRGDFEKTMSLLQRLDFADDLSRSEGSLFRAAAGYALYNVGGNANAAYRQQAIDDLQQYRRLRKVKSLDARLFAPSFRSLYLETAR
jgi:hypothetical protein